MSKKLKSLLSGLLIACALFNGQELSGDEATRPPVGPRMMSQKMQNALNEQLKAELSSAYLYMSISNYFDELNLDGFARWFRVQADEELGHFLKIYQFMQDRSANIKLPALEAPSHEFTSIMDAFESSLLHEQALTERISVLYGLSHELKEYDVTSFLMWFLQEQVEEEDLFAGVIERLRLLDSNIGSGIIMMDNELGSRVAI